MKVVGVVVILIIIFIVVDIAIKKLSDLLSLKTKNK